MVGEELRKFAGELFATCELAGIFDRGDRAADTPVTVSGFVEGGVDLATFVAGEALGVGEDRSGHVLIVAGSCVRAMAIGG